MKTKILLMFLVLLVYSSGQAQRSKDGAKTITSVNTVVNEYTALKYDAASGASTITVVSSTLNANGRFTANLSSGDLLMIIQLRGASILGTLSGTIGNPNDSTWGQITSYNNCGNYEFVQVSSVTNDTTIVLDCGLAKSYTATGKTVVVRVPRYSSLTVNNGMSITCDTWNGTTGGVVAIEVNGNTALNGSGSITATGKGFRGGQLTGNDTFYNLYNFATVSTDGGGQKGEGIAGYQGDYTSLGGPIGRGAAANAGGGGNGWTCGGGGGANAGNINAWNGKGNPDNSVAAWTTAWNLEGGSFSTNTSSGGGRGGYSWSSSNQNATTLAPGAAAWGGDLRANHGGYGGRPLDYSGGRIFLGGGGGAGDQDNNFGGAGGAGGGLIFIVSYGTVSGTGTIVSNGNAGGNATGTPPNASSFAGKDSGGGGGGGGTIILNSTGTISGISITANGGVGGNQDIVKGAFVGAVSEAEGPGGGGGGGYIALSNTGVTQSVLGGANGTTDSDGLTEFIPNGATRGGAGLSGQSISNYNLTAVNATVCSGASAALSVTITGTAPAGSVVTWYAAQTGGAPLFSGATYNTPALGSTTTYYAQLCPGTFRIPVVATVTAGITVSVTPTSANICPSSSVVLNASGATTYSWSPAAGLSAATGSSVTASPAATTTYTVTGTSGTCTDTSVAIMNVVAAPVVSVTPAAGAICSGSSVTFSASGANTYSWTPATDLNTTTGATVIADPTSTLTYTVTGTSAGGCTDVEFVPVQVTPLPLTAISPATVTICSGASTTLNATGATTYTWSPAAGLSSTSASSVTATPAATTTYTVTGTASGCSATATSIVTVNANPVVIASPGSSAVCPGSSVNITASGASTYSWSPAAGLSSVTSATVTATPAATTTYTVTGTTNGCTDTAYSVVNVLSLPVVSVSPTADTLCAGSSTTLTASGAVNYSWSPSAGLSTTSGASVIATPSSTTTYTVTGTNAQGCSASTTVIITVNPLPGISVSPVTSSICQGTSVTLTASNAASYSWSPSTGLNTTTGSTVIASPASTTTYTVTGTSNNCEASVTSIVTVTPSITVTYTLSNDTICQGSSAAITANGAASYQWGPASGLSSITGSSVSASPSTTTTYTITGTSGACTDAASFVLTVIPSFSVAATASADPICSGGSSILTASGATTYSWSPTASLSSATGTPVISTPASTTTYTVTGTVNGCTDTASVILTVTPSPDVDVTPINSTICSGGTVTLDASGASTYSWSPSAGLSSTTTASVTADPSVTTTYTVTGTASGCTDTAIAIVNVASSVVVSVTPANSTICSGDNIILTANGAATYTWSPAGGLSSTIGQSVSAGPATTSTYTVTGSSGTCSDTAVAVVSVLSAPALVVSVSDTVICFGETVSFTATGGLTYSWQGSGLSSTTGSSVSATPAVTDTFKIVAANGSCTDTAYQIITVNPSPVVQVSPATFTLCSGDTITLTASGAGSYTWEPSAGLSTVTGSTSDASPASTTTYTVTGTTSGCTDTAVAVVNVTSVITATVTMSNDSICEGDTISLSASGAVDYSWLPAGGLSGVTGANISASPSSTTTYTLTASSGSCSDTLVFVLNVDVKPTVTVTTSEDTICSGSSVDLSATGANDYTWSPASSLSSSTGAMVSGTPSATTTYAVIGRNGVCADTATVEIFVNASPVVSVSAAQDSICNGNSMQLTASGASNYLWSPSTGLDATSGPVVNADPSSTETYTLTGSNGQCEDTTTFQLTVIDVVLSANITSATICEGDSVKVSPSGADSYTWSPTINSQDPGPYYLGPAVTTTYTVTGTTFVCTDTLHIPVYVEAAPALTVTATDQSICQGSSTSISVSGASSYFWSPGTLVDDSTSATVIASPLVTTTFTVAGISGNCGTIDTVIINVIDPVITVTASPAVICTGNSTTLTASGASVYTWTPSPALSGSTGSTVTATPSTSSSFTVTGTDSNGCVDSASVFVTVESPPAVSAGPDQTSCLPVLQLSANDPSPLTGGWSLISGPGSITDPSSPTSTVTGLSSGTTVLVWSISSSCGNISDTVQLNITGGPALSLSSSPMEICPGESAVLNAVVSNASGAVTYNWDPASSNSSSITVTPSSTQSYSLSVTDGNGCVSNEETVTVVVHDLPVVSAGADVTITEGESTTLIATGAASYSWTPATSLSAPAASSTNASPPATIIYTVTGTDANGCSASDEVTVTVQEKSNYFIPDIFSPNGDGNNDVLFVRGGNIQSVRFQVFDRWGEKVFETEDLTVGWDGTFRGKAMDEAVYVYIVRGTYGDGSFFEQFGNVTLIR